MTKSALFMALVLSCSAPLLAQTAPMLEFSVGGNTASLQLTAENGDWSLAAPETVNGSEITNATIQFDSDPSITYGYGVYNGTGSTQTYSIVFPQVSGNSSPLAVNLPPGLYSVKASLAVTVTDDGNLDGATFSQVNSSTPYQQDLLNSTDVINIGTGTLNIPSGTVDSETFPFTSVSNPAYSLGSTATTMSILTSFDLSAGVSASFSGSFTITAVPEPSSFGFALIAAGAFGLLVVCARRSRA